MSDEISVKLFKDMSYAIIARGFSKKDSLDEDAIKRIYINDLGVELREIDGRIRSVSIFFELFNESFLFNNRGEFFVENKELIGTESELMEVQKNMIEILTEYLQWRLKVLKRIHT